MMLFASLDAFAAVCATAHTSLQVNRQTERSSVGAASRWGAHPPGFEPVALHLPGFSRIFSGKEPQAPMDHNGMTCPSFVFSVGVCV